MENKEFSFNGLTLGGFTMLFGNIALTCLLCSAATIPPSPW